MYVNPNLPVHPILPLPLGIHTFTLYICVSINVLYIIFYNPQSLSVRVREQLPLF